MVIEPMQEYTIPDKVIKGNEVKIVWDGKDGYIYKAYLKDSFESITRQTAILNTLQEYENESIVGIANGHPVTKLRKLKDWLEILATFFFTDNKRLEDWEQEVKQFLTLNNYIKKEKYYYKDDKILLNIKFRNIGMDENNNFKIIDCYVL